MSTSSGSMVEEESVATLFLQKAIVSESSIEPPMEEWSSLDLEETPSDGPKVAAYKLGLYYPGSGEICTKYIAQSDSDVLNHVYYAYPSVKDPGILRALTLPEPKIMFDTCGQELYMALCEEMGIIPVRKFYRSLVEKEINLKYYGVNPAGVRAMCLSMTLNHIVKRLDLTSNNLSNDACFHIGQLLKDNLFLDELVLAQCKIGPSGIQRVVSHLFLRTMDLLDLSSTGMGDEGFSYLAAAVQRGAVIKRLNLSHNDLGAGSAILFAEAIEFNNSITHLDISWNKLYQPSGSGQLFRMLSDNPVLVELNVSWNNLTSGIILRKIVMMRSLHVLDLSNNRLGTPAARAIALKLPEAKKLHTLDLSHNPFGPADGLRILEQMKSKKVKVVNLFMADVGVSKEFMVALQEVLELPYRKETTITYGRVIRNYTLSLTDLRLIVMRRLDYLFARSSKRCKLDIGLYIMEQRKARRPADTMLPQEFLRLMKINGLQPDEGLVEEMMNLFPGPKGDKGKRTIALGAIEEYINRLWPEKKLPPTPPPPPPPPPPKSKGKKKKATLKK